MHCNENSSLHLSKPTRGLRQWKSLSRALPSLRPSILRATTEIYLAMRQERQCKSNPPPINYLFHSPFSSFSLHLPPPVPHPRPTAVPLFLHVTRPFPSLISSPCGTTQHSASHCNINLPVRGAVAMWKTCHCNRQLDKCRRVAEHRCPHCVPPPCYPQCIVQVESRRCDARRGYRFEE